MVALFVGFYIDFEIKVSSVFHLFGLKKAQPSRIRTGYYRMLELTISLLVGPSQVVNKTSLSMGCQPDTTPNI